MLNTSGCFRRWRRAAGVRLLVAAAVAFCAAWAGLGAATATFWSVSTQADFLKGDVEDLSIDADGRIVLGPTASVVGDTSEPFVWTVIAGADGTLWAGTGNEGKVLQIAPDGRQTTFFDATELEVHAIAPAPGGGLYVATSPDGKIYQVSTGGTSKTFYDPEDKYIWALAVDRGGNVFAATGDKGMIYKIAPDGRASRFYKTNAGNVITLAFTPSGDLIAGTESPGRIFRIDPAGKAFVLLDSPYKEIHSVRLAQDGTIYATAVSPTQGGESGGAPYVQATSPEPPRAPVPSVSTEITTIFVVDTGGGSTGQSASRGSRRAGKGAVYRIKPDGLWDLLWDSGDDAPYDVAIEPAGTLLVATGVEGKLFRVGGEPARATLLARASAKQITALVREASGRVVGAASNPGKLFALSSAPARRGTYESDIRDAGNVATWGIIRWRAALNGGQVEILTRSGNTATPDETWSPWSKPYANASGEPITSPNARYLQWRAALTTSAGEGPVLTSVTAAYLPRNVRPEVTSITVHPPGTIFQRPFSTGEAEIAGFDENTPDKATTGQQASGSTGSAAPPAPALGRRTYQKGLQTIVWKSEDNNDDRLQFDVLYRREGETTWRPLRRGLWDPIFVWDTTSVPDGTYFVKIAATDAPSNSHARALVGELESTTFDIDNTPPRIDLQAGPRGAPARTLSFAVRDEQSAVQRVEYSLDASRWRVVYPKDGIPDSRREEFEIQLDATEGGRSVIIRATDAMNNVATAVAGGL